MVSVRYDPELDSDEDRRREPLNITLRRDSNDFYNIPEAYQEFLYHRRRPQQDARPPAD